VARALVDVVEHGGGGRERGGRDPDAVATLPGRCRGADRATCAEPAVASGGANIPVTGVGQAFCVQTSSGRTAGLVVTEVGDRRGFQVIVLDVTVWPPG
jgi:hypothetical protein